MRKWLTVGGLLVMFCTSSRLHAEVSGYLKTLWLSGETVELLSAPMASEDFVFGINRWRWQYQKRIENIRLEVQYDQEIRLGSYLETQQYAITEALTPEPYWNWQNVYHREEKLEARHRLYRATIATTVADFDVRAGRQQINWARTFLWSSFDRFNPYDPLQIEEKERRGVDGIRVSRPLGELQSLELVGVGGHNSDDRGLGALWKTHVGTTDIDVMAADFGAVDSVGVAAAGQLRNAGWRLEATANRNENDEQFNEWIAGIDYTFASQTTVIGELLYRGDGAELEENYDVASLLSGQRTNLAQRYAGIVVRQSYDTLANIELTALYNTDDGSSAWRPVFIYNPGPFPDLQLRLGATFFEGNSNSEYGQQNTTLFAELQWYY